MSRKSPSIGDSDPSIQRSVERSSAQETAIVSRTGKAVASSIADLIRGAKRNFVPIVGSIYHLYKSGEEYMLSPTKFEQQPKLQFIGSFRLSVSDIWEKV